MAFEEGQCVKGKFRGVEFKGLVRGTLRSMVLVLLDKESQEKLRGAGMPVVSHEMLFDRRDLSNL